MGFFGLSGKKYVETTSFCYNLGGEYKRKNDYDKKVKLKILLDNLDFGIYYVKYSQNGIYQKYKKVIKQINNENFIGEISASFNKERDVDYQALQNYLDSLYPSNVSVIVNKSFVDIADHRYFVQKHIIENNPSKLLDDYIVELTTTRTVNVYTRGYSWWNYNHLHYLGSFTTTEPDVQVNPYRRELTYFGIDVQVLEWMYQNYPTHYGIEYINYTALNTYLIKNKLPYYGVDEYKYLTFKPSFGNGLKVVGYFYISFTVSYNESAKITYTDNSTETINLTNLGFERNKDYLYVYYDVVEDGVTSPITIGTLVTSNTLPNTNDYLTEINTTNTVSVNLETTVTIETVNNSTNETITETNTSTQTVSFNKKTLRKKRFSNIVNNNSSIQRLVDIYNEWLNYEIVTTTTIETETIDYGSYTETVTTTTITESLENKYSYRFDYYVISNNVILESKLLTYKLNSGNTVLDQIASIDSVPAEEFYPVIPLRIHNTNIMDTYHGNSVSTLYKKLTNTDINKLIKQLENTNNLDKIDFAYLVLGVPLNTKSNHEKLYIYNFLKNLISIQKWDRNIYLSWRDSLGISQNQYEMYLYNLNLQYGEINFTEFNSSRVLKSVSSPAFSIFSLATKDYGFNGYYTDLRWLCISEHLFTGVGKVGAKPGDLWWDTNFNVASTASPNAWFNISPLTYDQVTNTVLLDDKANVALYHQIDSDTYRVLLITGLEMYHRVYGGEIWDNKVYDAKSSILDLDDTSFVIPLHEPTLQTLTLYQRHNVCLRSQNLIINTLDVYKQNWYETGAFANLILFIVTVVIVAVTILSGGTLTAQTTTLGSTVLGAIGITTAVVAINFIVGLISSFLLSLLIERVLREVFELFFDDKVARILSTVTTVIITLGTNNFTQLSFDIGFQIPQILTILSTLTNSFSDLLLTDYNSKLDELNNFMLESESKTKLLEKKINETGIGKTVDSFLIDYIQDNYFKNVFEKPQDFFNRTLLNSTDIINASLNYTSNYSKIKLDITLP